MKVHPVFSLKYLRPYTIDPLPGQYQEPPRPIVVNEGEEYTVDDILDSRRYRGRLQYKVKWSNLDRNDQWYYTDKNEFANSQEVVDKFHRRYP